jgi:hypothetical protein
LTRISNTCDALDAARCERDTLDTNPGDVNEGQGVYARGTSSGIKTRTTYEGGDGDRYQEAEGGDEEEEEGEERDRMSESDQEHEAGSEDEDEYDDNGDGEDKEENDEEMIRKTMTRKREV